MTAAEFEKLVATFPADLQKAARSNPKQVMQSYFLMESLTREAEKEKLDETSPLKEQLQLHRMQLLAQTLVNRELQSIPVSAEDEQKRYDADQKKYEQAKVRGILIGFGDPQAINAQVDMSNLKDPKVSLPKGLRTQAEAEAIAKDLVAEARGGADFSALDKAKSDDKTTGAKGGDFGVTRQSDNLPSDVKKAIFSMKPGEVSDPIKQPIGYYILKVEERNTQPLSEVRQQVANDVRQERFQKWMAGKQKQFEVKVENPGFFGQ